MTERRPVIESALDVLVYAPVGLAVEIQRILPELAREGRTRFEQRVTLARFVGRLAVRTGRERIEQRLSRPAVVVPPVPSDTTPVAEDTRHVERSDTAPSEPVPAETDLALPGYSSLSASQVVGRLSALSSDELAAIALYERAHRGRRTVLGKIEQLRVDVA